MKSTPSPATSKPPRLRVGLKDVTRDEFSAAVQERLGKQRVSIMLDSAIIAFFKAKAGERGYQTLINEALKNSLQQSDIEATIRKVIREELKERKAA